MERVSGCGGGGKERRSANSLRSSVLIAPSQMPRSLDWLRTGRGCIVSGFRYFLRGLPVVFSLF